MTSNTKPCILIYDHQELERNYLFQFLKDRFMVLLADSKQNALELFRHYGSDIQLILTTLVQDSESAVHFINLIKEEFFLPPVIVITAEFESSFIADVMVAGAFDVLSKPYFQEELLVIIDKALDHTNMFEQFIRHVNRNEWGYELKNQWLEHSLEKKALGHQTKAELQQLLENPLMLAKQLGIDVTPSVKQRILIIEDESMVRDVVVRMLRPYYRVSVASTATEGLEVLAEDPEVAIVLLDIGLPDIPGNEALVKIKEQYQVGVVMLTAYTEVDIIVECIRHGASDYIAKPFEEAVLLKKVSQVLTKQFIQQVLSQNVQL